MRKEYTINELAQILGCSRTAIVKKIKVDSVNPSIERYKNRYDVVISNGIKAILLDDYEIEQEKACSRGAKTVINNGYKSAEDEDIIDIEPEKNKISASEVLNFTERYISEFKTFQETTYNEIKNLTRERDEAKNQIYLLTDSEKRKEDALVQTLSENTTLKKRNTMLSVALGVALTVLICFITFYITYTTLHNTITQPVDTPEIKKDLLQQNFDRENSKNVKQEPRIKKSNSKY